MRLKSSERNISRAKLAERYKSVMLANHPDRGGSPYLALKINEARRILNDVAR
jgi:DnaJ family protein C protein 19